MTFLFFCKYRKYEYAHNTRCLPVDKKFKFQAKTPVRELDVRSYQPRHQSTRHIKFRRKSFLADIKRSEVTKRIVYQ